MNYKIGLRLLNLVILFLIFFINIYYNNCDFSISQNLVDSTNAIIEENIEDQTNFNNTNNTIDNSHITTSTISLSIGSKIKS
jgi:hypothetical protein